MFKSIIVASATYLATTENGHKIAKKGFKVLSKLGNIAVKSMPDEIGNVFRQTEDFVTNLTQEDNQNENV